MKFRLMEKSQKFPYISLCCILDRLHFIMTKIQKITTYLASFHTDVFSVTQEATQGPVIIYVLLLLRNIAQAYCGSVWDFLVDWTE